jgi:hypothetical protein
MPNDLLQLIYEESRRIRDDLIGVREEQAAHSERFAGIDQRLATQHAEIVEIRKTQVEQHGKIEGSKARRKFIWALAVVTPSVVAGLVWVLSQLLT